MAEQNADDGLPETLSCFGLALHKESATVYTTTGLPEVRVYKQSGRWGAAVWFFGHEAGRVEGFATPSAATDALAAQIKGQLETIKRMLKLADYG